MIYSDSLVMFGIGFLLRILEGENAKDQELKE